MMSVTTRKGQLPADDVERLCSLLQAEQERYRELLSLAQRQNSALRNHDLEELEQNSSQWQALLPPARRARRLREAFAADLARKLGVSPEAVGPKYLIDTVDDRTREIIGEAIQRLIETATALDRQNELNRRLAAFCCDLAREEAEIFKHSVLADPAGCYDEDARKTTKRESGLFIRQA